MTQVVIAGGGLAGAAAACRLAQVGRRVLLIEREAAPTDKICGEFLSNGALLHLERLGLDVASLGAQPITHLRLVRDGQVVRSPLPFRAAGLSRRVLDAALLDHAAAAGAEIHRGHAATLAGTPADLRLEISGLGSLRPRHLLLATGKHDLRGLRRETAAAPEDLVGFKTYFALAPGQQRSLSGHIEVMMLPDGYAGLQMVEGNRANLCLLVDRQRLQRTGGWPGLLSDLQATCRHLRQRLEGAAELLERPLAIYRVPYGFLHQGTDLPNLFRLGDQMGVIPSFAGDGMAIALHSAALAAKTLLEGADAATYHRQAATDFARQITRALALYRFGHWPWGQALMMTAAGLWPGLLRLAATATRVPEGALRRAC